MKKRPAKPAAKRKAVKVWCVMNSDGTPRLWTVAKSQRESAKECSCLFAYTVKQLAEMGLDVLPFTLVPGHPTTKGVRQK